MSYKNKFGITRIRTSSSEELTVSWDYDSNPQNKYPVLLFTPDIKNTDEHYHIVLTPSQSRKLKDWLDAYLKDRPVGPQKTRKNHKVK